MTGMNGEEKAPRETGISEGAMQEKRSRQENEWRFRLGLRILLERNRKSLSQKELAHRLGISRQHLSRIEHGKSSCSVKLLRAIAGELEMDLCLLLKQEKENGG